MRLGLDGVLVLLVDLENLTSEGARCFSEVVALHAPLVLNPFDRADVLRAFRGLRVILVRPVHEFRRLFLGWIVVSPVELEPLFAFYLLVLATLLLHLPEVVLPAVAAQGASVPGSGNFEALEVHWDLLDLVGVDVEEVLASRTCLVFFLFVVEVGVVVFDLLLDLTVVFPIDQNLLELVTEKLAGKSYVDRCFDLVPRQNPKIDPRLLEEVDCFSDLILQPVLDGCSTDQHET